MCTYWKKSLKICASCKNYQFKKLLHWHTNMHLSNVLIESKILLNTIFPESECDNRNCVHKWEMEMVWSSHRYWCEMLWLVLTLMCQCGRSSVELYWWIRNHGTAWPSPPIREVCWLTVVICDSVDLWVILRLWRCVIPAPTTLTRFSWIPIWCCRPAGSWSWRGAWPMNAGTGPPWLVETSNTTSRLATFLSHLSRISSSFHVCLFCQ